MKKLELQEMQQIDGGNWLSKILCSIYGGGPCGVNVDDDGDGQFNEIWFP
ncbi:MAG: hypothetical protein H6558_07815 [Lewinellaceae bacterium]|nr:hypothetical protein [Lewinellaceae bacterium]MCB9291054.1 hypothetical protein [Lewinellaceae bacterium]